MKKFIAISFLLLGNITLFAQNPLLITAWNYLRDKEYVKAIDAIEKVVVHEQTMNNPKAWHYRALIYHDVAIDTLAAGLDPDPLTKSLESVKKSMQLDLKKMFDEKNKRVTIDLATLFFNDGVSYYNDGIKGDANGFKNALNRFNQYFESIGIVDKYAVYVYQNLVQSNIDPNDVYLYAGISANQCNDNAKAREYFTYLVTKKYTKAAPYIGLADVMLQDKDTTGALNVIEQGKKMVTDVDGNKNLTIKELEIYQASGKLDDLIIKLENAVAAEPTNSNLIITLGESYYAKYDTLYKLKKFDESFVYRDKAIESYKKSIDMLSANDNELLFLLNNKIGTIYFNTGVDFFNKTIDEKDLKKVKVLEAEYNKYFDMALPYLTTANELNPEDKPTIEVLKNIYIRRGEMDKLAELTKPKGFKGVIIGMEENLVIQKLGKPIEKNVTIYEGVQAEQWIYSNNVFIYFENGKVKGIQFSK